MKTPSMKEMFAINEAEKSPDAPPVLTEMDGEVVKAAAKYISDKGPDGYVAVITDYSGDSNHAEGIKRTFLELVKKVIDSSGKLIVTQAKDNRDPISDIVSWAYQLLTSHGRAVVKPDSEYWPKGVSQDEVKKRYEEWNHFTSYSR